MESAALALIFIIVIPTGIYALILAFAPKKTKKDEKILSVLWGVVLSPVVIYEFKPLSIGLILIIWLAIMYFAFKERKIPKHIQAILLCICAIGLTTEKLL